MQNAQWVRVRLASLADIDTLRQKFAAEIHRATLRRVDSGNLLIEAYVPSAKLSALQSRYVVRLLGDVDQIVSDAARHVSRVNRYQPR